MSKKPTLRVIKKISMPKSLESLIDSLDKEAFLEKVSNIFESIEISEKRRRLKELSKEEALVLYTFYDFFTKYLILREFGQSNKSALDILDGLFLAFLQLEAPASSEEEFMRALCRETFGILYILEQEMGLSPSEVYGDNFDQELAAHIVASAVNGLLKDFSSSEFVKISTAELVKYPRRRVNLRDDDCFFISKPRTAKQTREDGQLKITQACTIEICNWKILFGFYSEDNNWVSEKHIPPEVIDRITEAYGFKRRELLVKN